MILFATLLTDEHVVKTVKSHNEFSHKYLRNTDGVKSKCCLSAALRPIKQATDN